VDTDRPVKVPLRQLSSCPGARRVGGSRSGGDRGSRIEAEVKGMTITVPAVYEGGGVLKLERPVDLKENAKVNVTIETGPEAVAGEDDDPTGWKAIDALRGIVKGTPDDMAENHDKYLYGGHGE
jgi:predicted DNA-binding antitoxin AbrB/MazE fold protein